MFVAVPVRPVTMAMAGMVMPRVIVTRMIVHGVTVQAGRHWPIDRLNPIAKAGNGAFNLAEVAGPAIPDRHGAGGGGNRNFRDTWQPPYCGIDL